MIRATMLKEWVKLRFVILGLGLLALILIAILTYQTYTLFLSSEPEALLWHRFVFFDAHPHAFLKAVYVALGFILALAQFYTERHRGRILVHLPIAPWFALGLHQLVGLGIIIIFGLIISIGLWLVFVEFYPDVLLHVSLYDNLWSLFGGCLAYLGGAALVMEPNPKTLFLKAFCVFTGMALFMSLDTYEYALLWLVAGSVFGLLGVDSILAISNKRLRASYPLIALVLVAIVWIGGVQLWDNTAPKRVHYYPFYSTQLKTFVYQRNLGGHDFQYGTIEGKRLDFKEFKAALPFVYWRDLQTQGKLPITINNLTFDANSIKKERLSLAYSPSLLNPPRVGLYPLFNPDPKVGIIPFPQDAIYLADDGLRAYHHHGQSNKPLSDALNNALLEAKFHFPIQNIWGKFTNLKPYDLGIFLQDSKDNLYNLIRYGDALHVSPISTPQKLEYLHISENARKQIAGFAIDKSGQFYILKQDGFSFVPLDLPYFDYRKMDLQFLSDPLHNIVRYDDGKNYFIHLFSKDFTPIDFAQFDKNSPPKEL